MPGDRTMVVWPASSAEYRRRPRRVCVRSVGETLSDFVGDFNVRVACGHESPESRQRWEQRSEALAAWLLSRWREQQGEEGRN